MRALLSRLGREDRGITLVELIVAMAVTSLLLALVGGFFVSITRAQQAVSGVDDSTRQGSTAITQVSRYLREATRLPTSKTVNAAAFISATSSKVDFYSAVDLTSSASGITRVTVDVSAGHLDLTLRRMTADANGYYSASRSETARTVRLADVVRDANVFGYVDVTGGDPVANPRATAYDGIRSVDVDLSVGSSAGGSSGDTANDTAFDVRVNLRNLDYGTATG